MCGPSLNLKKQIQLGLNLTEASKIILAKTKWPSLALVGTNGRQDIVLIEEWMVHYLRALMQGQQVDWGVHTHSNRHITLAAEGLKDTPIDGTIFEFYSLKPAQAAKQAFDEIKNDLEDPPKLQ